MSETKNVQNAASEPGQPGKTGKKYAGKAVLLILFAAAIGAYFVRPPYRDVIDSIFSAFATGDFAAVRSFVERYGAMAEICIVSSTNLVKMEALASAACTRSSLMRTSEKLPRKTQTLIRAIYWGGFGMNFTGS